MKFKKDDYIISKDYSPVLHKIIRCNKKSYRLKCIYNPYNLNIARLCAEGLWSIEDLSGRAWSKSSKYIETYYKKYPKLKGVLYET